MNHALYYTIPSPAKGSLSDRCRELLLRLRLRLRALPLFLLSLLDDFVRLDLEEGEGRTFCSPVYGVEDFWRVSS